jgi:hypothetical protein
MIASITGFQSNGSELLSLLAAPALRGIREIMDKLRQNFFTNLFIISIIYGLAKGPVIASNIRAGTVLITRVPHPNDPEFGCKGIKKS